MHPNYISKRVIMRKVAFVIMVMSLPLIIAACNTFKGMGEDISSAATTTQKAIR